MRENRLSGSEGGGVEANRLSLPLYEIPARPLLATLRAAASLAQKSDTHPPRDLALLISKPLAYTANRISD